MYTTVYYFLNLGFVRQLKQSQEDFGIIFHVNTILNPAAVFVRRRRRRKCLFEVSSLPLSSYIQQSKLGFRENVYVLERGNSVRIFKKISSSSRRASVLTSSLNQCSKIKRKKKIENMQIPGIFHFQKSHHMTLKEIQLPAVWIVQSMINSFSSY